MPDISQLPPTDLVVLGLSGTPLPSEGEIKDYQVPFLARQPWSAPQGAESRELWGNEGSGRASTGRCLSPCRVQPALPGAQEEIQVPVVPVWFIHLQPRHSFRIPSNILCLSWELREHGKDRGSSPCPQPSSVPRSSSASWITTSVENLKTSSSSQLGVAAPKPGVAVPKGMAAGGSGKLELEGLDAQGSASTSTLLLPHEFIPC